MLSHMLRAATLPADAFTASAGSATSASSFTFSAVNIGTPHPARVISVSLVANGSTSGTISSVTIGGTAAAELNQTAASTVVLGTATLAMPTGTTADIVVNSSVTRANGCAIIVHAIYTTDDNQRSIDSSAFSTGATSRTASVTVQNGDVLISSVFLGAPRTITWSNVTANGSIANYSGTRSFYAAINSNVSSAVTSVTASWTSNTQTQLQVFVLR